MSVMIEHTAVERPNPARTKRGLKIARTITGAVYYVTLFMLLICGIAFAKVAVVDGGSVGWALQSDGKLSTWAANAAFFAQLTLGFLAFWVAAQQARTIVLQAEQVGTVFSCDAGRRLRVAAAALFALVLIELAFSLLFLGCQGQALLPVNIGFGFAGFPMHWDSLIASSLGAGTGISTSGLSTTVGSSAFTAQIDTTALLVSCLFWGLSYVFDYGGRLQSEQDATV